MKFLKRVRAILLLPCVFLFWYEFSLAYSDTTFVYKYYLKESAKRLDLHKDRYWHILLHYSKKVDGYESFIDDAKFFLSREGKKNPQSELLETIDSFFEIPSTNHNDHPRCRFIARYEWLKEKLNIDESKLPEVKCSEFQDVFQRVNPKSASLIFPSFYPNSPASMFGHTLLRLEGDFHSSLLAYAVNYSAIPEDDFALIYTFKGIFGYYKGIYTAMPYYDKVREYSDIERRDIWEYNLNLTAEEVKKMFLHLWELKDIFQFYYFFDENCSYNILFLIEAARPDVNLIEKFKFWVIPVDTIRVVIEEGLVEKIVYRPSIYTRIKFLSSFLPEKKSNIVLELVNGSISPEEILKDDKYLTLQERQKILEISAEILQYKYFTKDISKDLYQKRYLQVLRARSQLPIWEEENIFSAPSSPETGHESARLKIGQGVYNGNGYLDISIRPAYHDITNNDRGYIEGSQIVFTDLHFKYFRDKFFLERFDLINIISFSPFDYFSRSLSWRVKTGFERKGFYFDKDDLYYFVNAGCGMSAKILSILSYMLFNGSVEMGGVYKKNFSGGIGIEGGVIKNFRNRSKTLITLESMYYPLGDNHKLYKLSFTQNFFLNKNLEMGFSYTRKKVFSHYSYDFGVLINYFFR